MWDHTDSSLTAFSTGRTTIVEGGGSSICRWPTTCDSRYLISGPGREQLPPLPFEGLALCICFPSIPGELWLVVTPSHTKARRQKGPTYNNNNNDTRPFGSACLLALRTHTVTRHISQAPRHAACHVVASVARSQQLRSRISSALALAHLRTVLGLSLTCAIMRAAPCASRMPPAPQHTSTLLLLPPPSSALLSRLPNASW